MRKPLEKIAMIAHAGISFIFVLLTVLILFNILPLNYVEEALVVDSIVLVLVAVLAIFYAGLTVYLLYCVFNQNQLLRYVELYRDSTATVMATSKSIKKMAVENAKRQGSVKVKKIRITSDGKYGLVLKMWVVVKGSEVALTLDTLRCMCQDSFKEVLGLRFSSIDFKVEKIIGQHQPDIETAREQAKTLEAERKYASDCYQDPFCEKCTPPQDEQESGEQDAQPTDDDADGEDTQQADPIDEETAD